MKNKALKIFAYTLIVLIPLGLYAYQFFSFYVVYKNYTIKLILLSLLGLFITLIIASLVHELGHVIVGKISGLKVVNLKVLFLNLSFDDGFKISFSNPINFGETTLVPLDKEKKPKITLKPKLEQSYSKKIVKSAIGGLTFSLVYLLIGMIIVAFSKNVSIVLIFGISYHLSAYILLVNLVPLNEESDGFLVLNYCFKGDKEKQIIDNALNTLAQIMQGVQPKDLDSRLLTEFPLNLGYYSTIIKYYRYLAFLWRDEERAIKELFEISDLNKISYSLYEDVYKELFYSSIVIKDENFIKNNKDIVIGYIEKESSPIDYRIHASYRIYTGEHKWAKLIIESGISKLEKHKKYGNVSYEIELLKRLKERIK